MEALQWGSALAPLGFFLGLLAVVFGEPVSPRAGWWFGVPAVACLALGLGCAATYYLVGGV
jgi:hypothetical protein